MSDEVTPRDPSDARGRIVDLLHGRLADLVERWKKGEYEGDDYETLGAARQYLKMMGMLGLFEDDDSARLARAPEDE